MEDYSKSPVKKKAASNDEEFYDFDQSLLSSQYQSPLLSTSPDPNQKRDRLTRSEHSSIIINERQGAFDLEDCDWKQRLYLNTSESESFLHLESQSQLYSSLRNNHSFTHGQSGVGHSKTFFNFPKVSSNHKNLPDNHQDIFDNTPVLYEWQSPSTEPLNMFEKTILNDEEHVGLKNFDQQFLDKDTLVDTITNNNTDKFNLIKNVGIGERRSSMCTIPNDGVFSNLTARPEIMVLPKDAEDDLPPVN